MEGQKKGDCGHIMASVDPHGICVRCRECDLVNAPCSVCVAMTSVQREAALLACARRRRRLQRRKERAGSVCSSSSKQSSGSVDRPTPEPPVTGRGGTGAAPANGGGSKTAVSRPRTADGSAVDSAPTSAAAASHSGAAAPTRSPRYGEPVARDPRSPHLRGSMAGEAPLCRGRLTANQPPHEIVRLRAVALTPRRGGSSHAVE